MYIVTLRLSFILFLLVCFLFSFTYFSCASFFFSNKQDPNPQVKFFELFLPLTTIETILKRKLILKPLLCLNLIYSVVPPIRLLYLSPLFVNSNYLHLQNVHFLFYFTFYLNSLHLWQPVRMNLLLALSYFTVNVCDGCLLV